MMEALINAVLNLFKNLVILAGQGISVLGNVIALPGFIGLLIGGVFCFVAWKQTRNAVGAILWLLFAFATVFIISSYVIWPFLFKGSQNSLTNCYESAGSNSRQIAVCDSINNGFVVSASAQTQSQPIITVVEPPVLENPIFFNRMFKDNALELLTQGWNLNPPDWPRDIPGQLVGPKDVPQDVELNFECNNPVASLKNEKWNVTVSGVISGIGQRSVTLQTNGYFVRDKDGFNAKPGTTIVGTGTWDDTCPTCYVDKPVSTPTPVPTPTAVIPSITEVKFPQPICGYWGFKYQSGMWLVVPTTGGQADFSHATSVAKATGDITSRCPGESLPATP
ncbi:MAG: hypothetical protein GX943_03300 [Candidatus Pacebacteria bacterium]|jgi:hypothetical protein|nr:hypothetical protein [Candidatus Paceibacterota bacterium]